MIYVRWSATLVTEQCSSALCFTLTTDLCVMVRVLESCFTSFGLDFSPFHFHTTTPGKLFTHTHASAVKQCNFVETTRH